MDTTDLAVSPQVGGQEPLEAGEDTFALPAGAVPSAGKAVVHLPSVSGPGNGPPTPPVERDDGLANPQMLAAQNMEGLGIVGRIPEEGVPAAAAGRFVNGGREVQGILSRSAAYDGRRDQVRGVVDQDGDLDEGPVASLASVLPLQKVGADVSRF